jgi:hypothetical protein
MELFVKITDANTIPMIEELRQIMWDVDSSVSRVGNDSHLKSGEEITLSWDKWVDDSRWTNHDKSKEYLYFQFIQPDLFKIEVDDNASFVDVRAALLVTAYLAQKNKSAVKIGEDNWLSVNIFLEKCKKYIQCSFEDAVNYSLAK